MSFIAENAETTIQYPLGLKEVRGVRVVDDELITTAEAGEILGLTSSRVRQLIYELVEDKKLVLIKKGSVILIRRSDLKLLDDLRNPVGRPPKPK